MNVAEAIACAGLAHMVGDGAGFVIARLFCRERGIDPDAAEYDVVHSGWEPC